MELKKEWKPLLGILALFAAAYWLPLGVPRFDNALREAFELVKWYAREHVLLCLVPAFFIAGAIGVFVSQASVMKYLGPKANKVLAYGVASVSGTILAVCSCTVLPLFSGIYRMGAGIGPATAFLYSGPAINVLAIAFTARILGLEMGIARTVGAVGFSVVIGLLMHLIFRKEEQAKVAAWADMPEPEVKRPLWQNAVFFFAMVAILVFANWGKPDAITGVWHTIWSMKWAITAAAAAGLGAVLVAWFGIVWWKVVAVAVPTAVLALLFPAMPQLAFGVAALGLSIVLATDKSEGGTWFTTSWDFAKQIFPLLFIGVFFSGLFLGQPGREGLIPSSWVASLVGGNSFGANLFASVAGALMYFATLTEVPILQGLLANGMGKGPALALLLAGPALSLPSMIVLMRILGWKKALTYILLVVGMATVTGMAYGALFPA
ncbi:MAG: permease [Spirochaetes bacterium]|nr:permease [Spirochaetota bacterium]